MPRRPYRRLHVSPALRKAIADDARPAWRIAFLAGIPHSKFSALINSVGVPDTPKNVQRLQRIANAIAFPVTNVFVSEAAADQFDQLPYTAEAVRR